MKQKKNHSRRKVVRKNVKKITATRNLLIPTILTLLTLIIIGTFVLLSQQPLKNMYGKAVELPPVAITGCGVISQPGTYVLENDIVATDTPCISIQSENVILNGNNREITSIPAEPLPETPIQETTGVLIEKSKSTIQNLTITGYNKGIHVKGTHPARIVETTIENTVISSDIATTYLRGVDSQYADTLIIKNSTINLSGIATSSGGIVTSTTSGIIVLNSTIITGNSFSWGMFIQGSTGVGTIGNITISNNTFHLTSGATTTKYPIGIQLQATSGGIINNLAIHDNTFTIQSNASQSKAITLQNGNFTTLFNNTITLKGKALGGISVTLSNTTTINKNTITQDDGNDEGTTSYPTTGISIDSSPTSTLSDNTITMNGKAPIAINSNSQKLTMTNNSILAKGGSVGSFAVALNPSANDTLFSNNRLNITGASGINYQAKQGGALINNTILVTNGTALLTGYQSNLALFENNTLFTTKETGLYLQGAGMFTKNTVTVSASGTGMRIIPRGEIIIKDMDIVVQGNYSTGILSQTTGIPPPGIATMSGISITANGTASTGINLQDANTLLEHVSITTTGPVSKGININGASNNELNNITIFSRGENATALYQTTGNGNSIRTSTLDGEFSDVHINQGTATIIDSTLKHSNMTYEKNTAGTITATGTIILETTGGNTLPVTISPTSTPKLHILTPTENIGGTPLIITAYNTPTRTIEYLITPSTIWTSLPINETTGQAILDTTLLPEGPTTILLRLLDTLGNVIDTNTIATTIKHHIVARECMTIKTNTILTTDVTGTGTCFIITGNNLVIDGNNHTIRDEGKGTGMIIRGTNVTIRNLTITNYSTGIESTGNNTNILTTTINLSTTPNSTGINLSNAQNSTITNTTILTPPEGKSITVENSTVTVRETKLDENTILPIGKGAVSETRTITITVTNTGGTPLVGVTLALKNTNGDSVTTTTTDARGISQLLATLPKQPPQNYTLAITKTGYTSNTTIITRETKTVNATLALIPEIPPEPPRGGGGGGLLKEWNLNDTLNTTPVNNTITYLNKTNTTNRTTTNKTELSTMNTSSVNQQPLQGGQQLTTTNTTNETDETKENTSTPIKESPTNQSNSTRTTTNATVITFSFWTIAGILIVGAGWYVFFSYRRHQQSQLTTLKEIIRKNILLGNTYEQLEQELDTKGWNTTLVKKAIADEKTAHELEKKQEEQHEERREEEKNAPPEPNEKENEEEKSPPELNEKQLLRTTPVQPVTRPLP